MKPTTPFQKFEKRHGGKEARVTLDHGSGMTFLYPDGAWAEVPPSGDVNLAMMANCELSSQFRGNRRDHDRRIASNKVAYWETLVELAEEEFQNLKDHISRSAEHGVKDEQSIKELAQIRDEVKSLRKELRKVERQWEKLQPGYESPAERRAREEEEEEDDDLRMEVEDELRRINI